MREFTFKTTYVFKGSVVVVQIMPAIPLQQRQKCHYCLMVWKNLSELRLRWVIESTKSLTLTLQNTHSDLSHCQPSVVLHSNYENNLFLTFTE